MREIEIKGTVNVSKIRASKLRAKVCKIEGSKIYFIERKVDPELRTYTHTITERGRI